MYGPLLIGSLLLPFLVLMLVGFLLPLANAIRNSVTGTPKVAESYVAVLHDPVYWTVLRRTFTTAALVSLICLIMAYPTAELINRASPKLRPVLLALVIIPLWSSTVARTYSWVGVFIRGGLIDHIAALFGKGPQQLLYTQPAVIIGMVHVLLPLLLLPVYAAVRTYDERLSLASLSLGAGRLRTLLQVKLPVLAPPILAGTVAIFIFGVGFFITPAVLGGPRSLLISNLISQQVFQRFDLARAQAMSIVLVLSVLLALAVLATAVSLVRRRLR